MYWLLYTSNQTGFDVSTLSTELIIGLGGILVGSFLPIVLNAIKEKTKWKTEKVVVETQASINQTQAVENIAQAASILLDQSHQLADKNASLVDTFESALQQQKIETQKERELRMKQQESYLIEIHKLQKQIEEINTAVRFCSAEILSLVDDLQAGREVSPERIQRLRDKWDTNKE